MKVTRRLKALVYAGWNVGWFILSATRFIDGAPAHPDLDRYLRVSLICYLASAGVMNFLFWYLFRMRDKSDSGTAVKASGEIKPPSA
jgi:hypothetical protein